jgi:hypothetical protein
METAVENHRRIESSCVKAKGVFSEYLRNRFLDFKDDFVCFGGDGYPFLQWW